MNINETLTKKQILNVFENNKDLILNTWVNLLVENEKNFSGFDLGLNVCKCILVNYINCLKNGNKQLCLKSIKKIVEIMNVNDISYNNFMISIPYFQESYISILLKNLKNEDVEKCITLCNRIYNKTVTNIQNEYLNINDSTLTAMIKLSELRDDTTKHHVERTEEYAVLLSKELNLDNNFIKDISKASLLHDIGKVAVRDEILLKPGKLTEDEYEEIKKHTTIGARTISKVISVNDYTNEYLYMAIDISLGHHEKYDGSGYPNGIEGIKIPLCARIFALVDAYDVITSERPYKKPFSHEEAVRRIKLDCGKHFDPDIVNAFTKIQGKFQIINNKYKQVVKY
jgi:HD-GYP domain-containing protein (c-di-GMP phosphodiesterase class II)